MTIDDMEIPPSLQTADGLLRFKYTNLNDLRFLLSRILVSLFTDAQIPLPQP